jgi:hypothetical protein
MLATEASAHAFEVMFAFELAQQGNTSSWDALRAPIVFRNGKSLPSAYLQLTETFAESYTNALQEHKGHVDALNMAGAQTFTAFMTKEQGKLNLYNSTLLGRYIAGIALGTVLNGQITFGYPGEGSSRWDDAKTKLTGKLSDQINITTGISLLAPEARFGTSKNTAWAFERAELYRLQKYAGTESEKYKSAYARAEENRNPYLTLDMDEVQKQLPGAWFGRSKNPVSVMNKMAGITLPPRRKQPKP